MRFLSVFVLATVAAQSVSAGWLGDAASSVKNSVAKTVGAAQDDWKELKEYSGLDNVLIGLENQLGKSDVLGSPLKAVRESLSSLQNQNQNLLQSVDEKFKLISILIADHLLTEASQLRTWANAALSGINDPKKLEKVREIVEKFMDQSMEKIEECAREAAKPIHEIYHLANNTAIGATTLAKNLVSTLGSNESQIRESTSRLTPMLKEGNELISSKILPLKDRLKDVNIRAGLSMKACVAKAKIATEIQKVATAARIKALRFML